MTRFLAAALAAFAFAALPALAIDAAKVPEEKRTKLGLYVDAKEAFELKKRLGGKALFVDIRTLAEAQYVGTPDIADAVVPYVELAPDFEWDDKRKRLLLVPQKSFVPGIEERMAAAGLGKDDVVILMCRSGERSTRGVEDLAARGFTKVYTVVDGFEGDLSKAGRREVNGWKNAGLPWTYKMTKEQAVSPARRPQQPLVPGRP